ncbi:hypothetical protein, partial [Mesorhizobium sp. M7A.T.Ca.US.000.02.1.1]
TLASSLLKAGGTMVGALLVAAGTAAATGLAFAGDADTGFYSPSSNVIGIANSGIQTLNFDASNRVNIGRTNAFGDRVEIQDNLNVIGDMARIHVTRFNSLGDSGGHVVIRSAFGTEAVPVAPSLSYYVGNFGVRPHDGTAFVNTTTSAMKFFAEQAFTPGHMSTGIAWTVTPVDSVTEAEQMWLRGTGSLALGQKTALAKLTVSANLSAVVATTISADAVAHFVGKDATVARMVVDSYANNPSYSGRRANGTALAPTALAVDDIIVTISGYGYGTTGYGNGSRGSMALKAAEAWTDTAQGTYAEITTTKKGTVTPVAGLRVDDRGYTRALGAFGAGTFASPIANYSVLDTDGVIICNKPANQIVLTLPDPTLWTGRFLYVVQLQAFVAISAALNVTPLAGGVASTAILSGAGKWAVLYSDAATWRIIAAN